MKFLIRISKFMNCDLLQNWFSCPIIAQFCRCILRKNWNREVIEPSLSLQRKHIGKDKENQKCPIIISFSAKVCLLLITYKTKELRSLLQKLWIMIWVGCIILNLILVKTYVKLRNLQILQNCQLWQKINFSNSFQSYVHIFHIYMFQTIIPKSVDPVTQVEQKRFAYSCFSHFINWKYFCNIWKSDPLLSSILQSISGRSTASTRPIQIYMDIRVSLLCFKYLATRKASLQI